MWAFGRYCIVKSSGFFRVIVCYETLMNYYQTNFSLVKHHGFSLTELEEMIPWERTVYVEMLNEYLKQLELIEKQKQKR